MRAIFGLVLVVGMGLAGFAVYMVKGHFAAQQTLLEQQAAKAQAIVPTTEIYAVNRSIGYGERLTAEDVQLIKYTQEFLPEGVFVSQEELFPQGIDVSRVVLRAMEPNEAITQVKVTDPGEDAGITTRLSPGMRAFAINVNLSTGVSGLIRPSDRVDIYWTGTPPNSRGNNGELTRLIETNVEVIAIDGSSDINRAEGEIARTVTVQVDPQDVATLTQAQASGKLTLSLLGKGDESIASATQVDTGSMLGIEEEAAPAPIAAPAPAEICTTRERRGAQVVETPIPCTN
ncbi:pilus assembly protein CpaB [Cognatiyoonia koreensis]|uniref:Pilus assembly protein CpaB n=1 Tax=Cognatiyoonia koreensis TaxID=364200 RepID=A0A1I0MNF5_9RHOB|nr:Flp pilus assembly protein CpaB [Cognatiyoonia koreensis]SEV89709.1 pilus assembly protein CpaB [Cognatiyoonia koreensis]